MVLIVLAVLILASFVVCYFSSKFWHWSHVLIVELLFLSAVGYFFSAAEYARIRRIYGNQLAAAQKQLDDTLPALQALQRGTRDEAVIAKLEAMDVKVVFDDAIEGRMLSTHELTRELAMITRTRGRVWRDVQTQNLDQATMTVTLGVPFPKPHGIVKDSIVYAFEQGPAPAAGQAGPQFLGEMRVINVAGESIQVVPTSSLDDRARARIAGTRFPWVLHENMPRDQYPDGPMELFAGMTEQQLRQILPEQSVEEYIRHGTPSQPDDDEANIAGFDATGKPLKPEEWNNNTVRRFRRQLRDYAYLFDELDKRLVGMIADRNALSEDNRQLEQANKSAQQVQAAYALMQKKLKFDLEGVTRDRQAIQSHSSQVATQLTNAQQLLAATREENQQLTQEILSQ